LQISIRLRGEAAITDRIFSFARSEHGNGRGFKDIPQRLGDRSTQASKLSKIEKVSQSINAQALEKKGKTAKSGTVDALDLERAPNLGPKRITPDSWRDGRRKSLDIENSALQKIFDKYQARSKNYLKPNQDAITAHTTFKTNKDGRVIKYETYIPNSQNPTGFDSIKRVDLEGKPHFNKKMGLEVAPPHVQGKYIPGGVRPAETCEIPRTSVIKEAKK